MTEKALFELLYAIAILCTLGIASASVYNGFRNPVNVLFSLAVLSGVCWLSATVMIINNSDTATGYVPIFWLKSGYFFASLIPLFFLMFVRFLSGAAKKIAFTDIFLAIPVLIILMLIYSDLLVSGVSIAPDMTLKEQSHPGILIFVMYFFSYYAVSMWMLIKKFSVSSGILRTQILYVIVGTLVPIGVSGTINILLPFLGIPLYWQLYKLSPLSTVLFAVSVSAAIFKYRFMAFHYAVGKGVFFALLASLTSIAYFSAIFLVARFFQGLTGNYPFIVSLFFFFILIVVFDPLRAQLEKLTDRVFLRSKMNFETAILEIGSLMSLTIDVNKFLADSLKIISDECSVSSMSFMMLDEKHDRFEIVKAVGSAKALVGYTMSTNYSLIKLLNDSGKPVIRRDAERDIGDAYVPSSKKDSLVRVLEDMQKISAHICVPGIVKGRVVVILVAGPKHSGDEFYEDDISFFVTAINQVSIFIENFKLLEKEKEAVKHMAESKEKEKYVGQLEKINKELLKAREELAKSERLSISTQLSISLQHEINNPLTSILALTQALLIRLSRDNDMDLELVSSKMSTVENEALRIRQLLERLSGITEPIIRDYMPGVKMIDLNAAEK